MEFNNIYCGKRKNVIQFSNDNNNNSKINDNNYNISDQDIEFQKLVVNMLNNEINNKINEINNLKNKIDFFKTSVQQKNNILYRDYNNLKSDKKRLKEQILRKNQKRIRLFTSLVQKQEQITAKLNERHSIIIGYIEEVNKIGNLIQQIKDEIQDLNNQIRESQFNIKHQKLENERLQHLHNLKVIKWNNKYNNKEKELNNLKLESEKETEANIDILNDEIKNGLNLKERISELESKLNEKNKDPNMYKTNIKRNIYLDLVLNSKSIYSVFGSIISPGQRITENEKKQLESLYRCISLMIHPDKVGPEGLEAMKILNKYRDEFN